MISWSEDCGVATDELNKFFKQVDASGDITKQYEQYLVDTGKQTSAFSKITSSAKNVVKSFGAALASMAVNWVISEVIGLAVTAIDNFINREEKLREKISELQQDMSETESTISDISTQLDEINQKILDINKSGGITLVEEDELEKLKNSKTELENQYIIEQEKHNQQQKELEEKVEQALNSKHQSKYVTGQEVGETMNLVNGEIVTTQTSLDVYGSVNDVEELKLASAEMIKQQEELNSLRKQYNDELKSGGADKDTLEKLQNQIDRHEEKLDEASEHAKTLQEKNAELKEGLDSTSESYKAITEAETEYSNAIAATTDNTNNLSESAKKYRFKFLTKNYSNSDEWAEFIDGLDLDQLTILGNMSIDENASVENVKSAIEKIQKTVDENGYTVETSVEFDPTDVLTESDDKSSTATLADLQSEADLLKTIEDELSNNQQLTISSMQNIIKQYPEAATALGDYLTGIISQEELFEELQNIYKDDEQNYKSSLVSKNDADGNFFTAVMENNQDLFSDLSGNYQEDFENFKNFATAKAKIIAQIESLYKGSTTDYIDYII
jgi:myosin heavy subunit